MSPDIDWDDFRKTQRFQFYIANEVLIGNAVALFLGDWTTIFCLQGVSLRRRNRCPPNSYLDLFLNTACVLILSLLTILYKLSGEIYNQLRGNNGLTAKMEALVKGKQHPNEVISLESYIKTIQRKAYLQKYQ